MHPLVKQELDNLERQFPGKAQLTLDDYAMLYGTNRWNAARHLRRRGIPASKEGKQIYISLLDLAIYKAGHKIGPSATLVLNARSYAEEMNSRRGFSKERSFAR